MASKKESDALLNSLKAMDRIQKRREAELYRICETDEAAREVAFQVAHEIRDTLIYLCSFDTLTSHSGKATPSSDAIDVLQDMLADAFFRVTGMDYVTRDTRTEQLGIAAPQPSGVTLGPPSSGQKAVAKMPPEV